MSGYQQRRSSRYSNLLITVKPETDERSVTEIQTNNRPYRSKNNYHSTTIYYNSNNRKQKQNYNRPSPPPTVQRHSPKYNHYSYYNQHYQPQQQPIRPLMEIEDHYQHLRDHDLAYTCTFKYRESKKGDQYRNQAVELDWDHGFDLEQIDLYTTQNDIDNYSLTSINSSTDNSVLSD